VSSIDVDSLVNEWLISKWLESSANEHDYRQFTRYDRSVHGPVSGLRVVTADADWDCGCYSSWTREDDFVMTAEISTAAGVVNFEYGRWADFPSFIEELDAYRNNDVCPYERDEEDEA
jgi:hypothetical protein